MGFDDVEQKIKRRLQGLHAGSCDLGSHVPAVAPLASQC